MARRKMTLEEKLEEAIVKNSPYIVPENWVWTKLDYVAKWTSGGTPKSTYPEYYNGDIPWIIIADMNDGEIYSSNKTITQEGLKNSSAKIIDKDSVLIAMYGSIGKLGINKIKCSCNQAIAFTKEIMSLTYNKFIYYYLMSYRDKIISKGKGGTQQNISLTVLKDVEIVIPPLKEQQRIVDKIESLFEKLDKAKELIEEARAGFEKRKSAILEKAFRGELTKEWRKNNKYKNTLLESLEDQNSIVKKNFKFSEATELFKLPNEWYWIKLKDICEKFKYGTSTKSKEEGKVPVLRMGNLQGGILDWTNLVYTSDEEEIKKYDLKPGDLLFNRTNSPELVGKTSIYKGEREAIYAGYLIRVRIFDCISPRYINYFMNSIFAKHRCIEVKSDGVSQSNINADKLGDFDIPLPSLEEQKEIVRILDKLLEEESKIDKLTQLENKIELIKKSILAKAFRGQLGTNCEEDESALELLKEILNT